MRKPTQSDVNYFLMIESPFQFRVQHGCRASDTGCTQCSVWTKFAGFCALYALCALYARCGHYYILTSNQQVERFRDSRQDWRIAPGEFFILKFSLLI